MTAQGVSRKKQNKEYEVLINKTAADILSLMLFNYQNTNINIFVIFSLNISGLNFS